MGGEKNSPVHARRSKRWQEAETQTRCDCPTVCGQTQFQQPTQIQQLRFNSQTANSLLKRYHFDSTKTKSVKGSKECRQPCSLMDDGPEDWQLPKLKIRGLDLLLATVMWILTTKEESPKIHNPWQGILADLKFSVEIEMSCSILEIGWGCKPPIAIHLKEAKTAKCVEIRNLTDSDGEVSLWCVGMRWVLAEGET